MKRVTFLLILLLFTISVKADDLTRIRATVYLPTGNKTATGITPYQGIIAADRSHLNQECELYTESGDFIGIFVCEDTGSHQGLKNGTRIDIYRDSHENYRKWVDNYGDYVLIKWR